MSLSDTILLRSRRALFISALLALAGFLPVPASAQETPPATIADLDNKNPDECLKLTDDAAQISCLEAIVTSYEQAVERSYQDALRLERSREEERRASPDNLAITNDNLELVVESQASWHEDYEERCSSSESGEQQVRLLCQYDMLSARLKDLQPAN